MHAVVDSALGLAELIESHADDAEQARRLPPSTVAALVEADLMRMCVPDVYGGPEVDPVSMLHAIAHVAHADGAAGWCSMIASTTSSLSSFLPVEAATEIYGDPASVTGGVFAPNGRGAVVERSGVDGVSVSGRWAWGSGTQHCAWVLGGALCDDDAFRLCWFPQSDVDFIDTWHTGGMRGSGSLDYAVDDAFAPMARTMQPGITSPTVDNALARFPNFTLLAAGVASVGLGIGRRALDELNDIAQGKQPQFSSRTLAHNGFTQVEFARAEAALRSARAFLLDEVESAWATVESGDAVTLDQRIAIRLAAVHAAESGVTAADAAFTLAGGTAVYDTSLLGRCMRDAHVVTQHIQTAPKLNEKIGKLMFGLDDDVSMF
ncbi:acyl-CoA dehydrogenase family protein [Ilumatobacter nonamiensis]|uniref:acyl-CoA dehydrogenase family protein n=1 Tax=Ilumatobacter nonamiensis TaxID=467093 RepID=UPI00058D1691|nr:acyl-CoA dehydrogenase family protein [Ilumatobacter nonamiensis]